MQCAEFALSSNHFFGSVSVIFVLQACQHWRSALKVTQKEDCMWVDLQCSKTSWSRWCWVLLHKQSTLKCCVVFSRRPKWKKRQDSRPCQGSHLYMYLHFPFHFLLTCTQMFVRLVDCERQTFLTNFFFSFEILEGFSPSDFPLPSTPGGRIWLKYQAAFTSPLWNLTICQLPFNFNG